MNNKMRIIGIGVGLVLLLAGAATWVGVRAVRYSTMPV